MSKTSTKKRKQTGAMGSKKTRRKNASKSLKESKAVQARKARDNIAEQYKSWDDKKPDQYVWEIRKCLLTVFAVVERPDRNVCSIYPRSLQMSR